MPSAYVVVSLSELRKLPRWDETIIERDYKAFMKILFSLGLDVKRGVEVQEGLEHRNKLNEIVTCTRFVGFERTDKEWLQSGFASTDVLYAVSDAEVQKEMRRLSKRMDTETTNLDTIFEI